MSRSDLQVELKQLIRRSAPSDAPYTREGLFSELADEAAAVVRRALIAMDDDTDPERDRKRVALAELTRRELGKAHEALARSGTRHADTYMLGQSHFEIPEVAALIIPLGKGEACRWGSMLLAEWDRWFADRADHVRQAEEALHRARIRGYDVALPYLREGMSTLEILQLRVWR